jgi:hypothetical protein
MIDIPQFERGVSAWAQERSRQFQYLWPVKGGWEGWVQVDLISYFIALDGTNDIQREKSIYTNTRERVDLLLNDDAEIALVPDVDKIPVEMKADSLRNHASFRKGVIEDLDQLEPAVRRRQFRNCDCLMLALTYAQESYDWLYNLRRGPQDVRIFGDIYLSPEVAVLGAHIDRNGVWRRARSGVALVTDLDL